LALVTKDVKVVSQQAKSILLVIELLEWILRLLKVIQILITNINE